MSGKSGSLELEYFRIGKLVLELLPVLLRLRGLPSREQTKSGKLESSAQAVGI